MIKIILLVVQMVLSAILIFLILVQPKGTGLGKSFASSSTSSFTRRGFEKWMFKFTFVIAICFIIASIMELVY
jgi:protein translocase SecG subunit